MKTLSEDHAKLATAVERARLTVEQKERAVDDIRKDLERESLEMEQHLADQVRRPNGNLRFYLFVDCSASMHPPANRWIQLIRAIRSTLLVCIQVVRCALIFSMIHV